MIFALHGFLGSSRDFDPLKEALSPEINVFAQDLPGHGKQGAERTIDLETTLAYLQSKHSYRRPSASILLGYSMGARIALNWVLNDPGKFHALILISGSPGIENTSDRARRRAVDDAWIRRIETGRLVEWIEDWDAQVIFKTPKPLSSHLRQTIMKRRQQSDPLGWAAAMRGLGNGVLPFLGERLSAIEIPTLLISGSEDHKFQNMNATIAQKMGDWARPEIVVGSGHRPHLEQPSKVADLIKTFLRNL